MSNTRNAFWKRFSLRALFVLTTLCCLLLGLWSAYVNPFRRQAQAVAALERLPVEIGVDVVEGPAWQRWLVTTTLGDDAYVSVNMVELRGPNVNDEVVRELAGLNWLTSLALEQTQVSNAGLSVLRSLPYLQELTLTYSQVTDDGLGQLQQLPHLQVLKLTGTPITDAAVPKLAEFPALQTLYIRWTQISDEGAAQLRGMAPNFDVYHHQLASTSE